MIFDSLSRIIPQKGAIEESSTATFILKRLKEIAYANKVAMIVIHHTPKQGREQQPMSIHTMAGSRVLGQEAEFMYGVNRTASGLRYMKEVALRHVIENVEVRAFEIDDHRNIKYIGNEDELSLLKEVMGAKNLVDSYREDTYSFCSYSQRC